MVGTWGEWHGSAHIHTREDRAAVVAALADALPGVGEHCLSIAIRTPAFLAELREDLAGGPLPYPGTQCNVTERLALEVILDHETVERRRHQVFVRKVPVHRMRPAKRNT